MDVDANITEVRTVGACMNQSVCCLSPTQTVAHAREFLQALDLTTAPVVDDTGRPLGVVSLRDLVQAADTEAVFVPMRFPCLSVPPSTSVENAADIILENAIHHLAVTDADGCAIGFLGSLDLLGALRGTTINRSHQTRNLAQSALAVGSSPDPGDLENTNDAPGVLMLVEEIEGTRRVRWVEATRSPIARANAVRDGTASPYLVRLAKSRDVSFVAASLRELAEPGART